MVDVLNENRINIVKITQDILGKTEKTQNNSVFVNTCWAWKDLYWYVYWKELLSWSVASMNQYHAVTLA